MNTTENKTTMNNEEQVNSKENNKTKSLSAKDRVMEDGKLSILEILYVSRYFLPVLTTLGWGLAFILNVTDGTFLATMCYILVGIGIISALTVSPLKFIKFIFKSTIKGFRIVRGFIPFYGVADLVAAIFGTMFGFIFGVVVVFGIPAVFTISKFFNEESFN